MTRDGRRLSVAVLAGGGAGLAVLVMSVWPLLVISVLYVGSGRVGLAGLLVLGAVCGLAAGYTARYFSGRARVLVALGAWIVWALTIASFVLSKFMPPEFGWAMLLGGLVGALIGAATQGRGAALRTPNRLLATGLLGALGGFAVLTLGIAALAYAAGQLDWFRFPGASLGDLPNVYTAYLYRRETALWAVIALAAAVSVILPVVAAGSSRHNPAAAALGLVFFLALGGLSSVAFSLYLSCSGLGSLRPFVWLTGSMSC